MKRAGFTMIELIFVIVILGILAAVALPRFIGVSEQAHVQKVESFVGTLNRTVGPALWSKSIMAGNGGSITTLCGTDLDNNIPVIEELTRSGCNYDANTSFPGVNDVNYTDGNATHAPVWSMQ